MNVAVIPARAGSKRIPRKNIRSFVGKPMLAWSIATAQSSKAFDKVLVSTDSVEVATIARECGAEVPFLRPAELSDDHATLDGALVHAAEWLRENGCAVHYLCGIMATAPLLQPKFLREGLEVMQQSAAHSAIACTEFPFPILRAVRLNAQGCLEMIWPEHLHTRSNDLEVAYHDAGQFYWLDVDRLLETQNIWDTTTRPIMIPRELVVDIDTPSDWALAEAMFHAHKRCTLISG